MLLAPDRVQLPRNIRKSPYVDNKFFRDSDWVRFAGEQRGMLTKNTNPREWSTRLGSLAQQPITSYQNGTSG